MTSTTFTAGDTAGMPTSGSVTDAPRRGVLTTGPSVGWADEPLTGGDDNVLRGAVMFCAINAWAVGDVQGTPDGDGDFVERFEMEGGPEPESEGDCCGVDSAATLQVRKWTRTKEEDPENPGEFIFGDWESVGIVQGTGTVSVTVNENRCCKQGTTCVEGTSACDGTCEEEEI